MVCEQRNPTVPTRASPRSAGGVKAGSSIVKHTSSPCPGFVGRGSPKTLPGYWLAHVCTVMASGTCRLCVVQASRPAV